MRAGANHLNVAMPAPLPTPPNFPPSPASTPLNSPRYRPSRRASLVNAKLSGMADSFIERSQYAVLAMKHALDNHEVRAIISEAQTLKTATGFVQATRVRAVCVALVMQCNYVIKVMEHHKEAEKAQGRRVSKEDMVEMAPNVWYGVREQIARLEKELAGFARSVQMARTSREQEPPDNKYTFDDTLEEREQEKAMLSWNKEVYEARVAKAYVQEKLVRALYQQQIQARATRIHENHKELVLQHELQGQRFGTPYTRKKMVQQATEDALAMAIEHDTPRFNDIDGLSPRVFRNQLERRGLSSAASSIASPASMRDLTRSVQLPPLNSLMNPRNQMTSPLPDKDTLLPSSRRKKRAADSQKQRSMLLPILLKFIAMCFEEKRTAESNLQKESGPIDVGTPRPPPIVSLLQVIDSRLHAEHGSSDICSEKFQQLKMSCQLDGHGMHPRVAIFRLMAGWDDHGRGMVPVQEAACVSLLSWLGIASAHPSEKDQRLVLKMKEVSRILDNLHRVRLLPPRARGYLEDLAKTLRIPPQELPGQPQTPMLDADMLVWTWMESWGAWDDGLFDEDPAMLPAAAPATEFY